MYSRKSVYLSLSVVVALVFVTYISVVSRVQRSAEIQNPDRIEAQVAGCNTNLFDITSQPQGHTMTKQCVQANALMYTGDSRFVFFDPPGGSGILPKGYPYVQSENVAIKDLSSLSWSITLRSNANVYVYYRRALAPSSNDIPDWLQNGYTTTTGTASINVNNLPSYLLRKNDQGLIGLYDAYKRTASNGTVVTFGPAGKPGISPLSMYLVAVVDDSPATTPPANTPTPPPSGGGSGVVFAGAGDIATCGGKAEATAAQIQALGSSATVFTLGDNAYGSSAYSSGGCYDKTWGAFKDRTYPIIGNHDWTENNNDQGAAYFNYFGQRVKGPNGLGYYSYNLGSWHLINLNTQLTGSAASDQLIWLRQDLQSSSAACVGALMHEPVYTQGVGARTVNKPYWDALYDAGAEIVLSAHLPLYERTYPLGKNGNVNDPRGIVSFRAGTGGNVGSAYTDNHNGLAAKIQVGSSSGFWGILKFTLKSGGYDFVFTPASNSPNSSFSDSGSASCH